MTLTLGGERGFLEGLFRRAVAAADPYGAIVAHLPDPPKGRLIVVGAGKAASQMAAAFERAWPFNCSGTVVARHGPTSPTRAIKVITAAHPVPDQASFDASAALLSTVSGLSSDDLVVALISGGGSALLAAPPEGATLADEALLNKVLLMSGAPISAMNVIRARFSLIKAGRLAAAASPARVVSLIVSDVPGDDPALVASGPTVPFHAGADEAMALIRDYRIDLPAPLLAGIAANDPPHPSDPMFARNETHVIASSRLSLDAAARAAKAAGFNAVILSDAIEGEARDIGAMHAALAREIATHNSPFPKPVLLLSGGETTVSIGSGSAGKGGRNSEFLLSFALAIDGLPGIHALAADTDGIDGTGDNAGAYADGETAGRLRTLDADGRRFLLAHESYTAFERADGLFVTGPTGTNVNDFRAILIL